jgi:hypothetical protein
MEATEYALRDRIDKLTQELRKEVNPKLGYSEIKEGHRVVKFKVHTLLLGDRVIPVGPAGITKALERVLRELEHQARYYKPSLLEPPPRKLPLWLNPGARAFASRATADDRGFHRFGEVINFPGRELPTREQIVYVSTGILEAFRYFPVDKTGYKSGAMFEAAMDWNRSMQTYVEQRRLAPSVARDTLSGLNRELLRRLILELAVPGTSDVVGTSGDILKTLVAAIPL